MDDIQGKIVMGKLIGKNPTCFDCQNAHILRGHNGSLYEPPEPDEAECRIYEQLDVDPEEYEFDDSVLPRVCGQFSPNMITKCGFCGSEMNIPEYLSQYHGYTYYTDEPIHVCSEECKKGIFEREQKDREEEEKIQKEYEEEQRRRWEEEYQENILD